MIFYSEEGEREYASTMNMVIVIVWYASTIKAQAWIIDYDMQSAGQSPIDFIKNNINNYIKCIKIFLSSNEGIMKCIMSYYPPEKPEKMV